jgi:hypothetical protein
VLLDAGVKGPQDRPRPVPPAPATRSRRHRRDLSTSISQLGGEGRCRRSGHSRRFNAAIDTITYRIEAEVLAADGCSRCRIPAGLPTGQMFRLAPGGTRATPPRALSRSGYRRRVSIVAGGKPVWLLDVDGVLNAPRPGWGGPPLTQRLWSNSDKRSYPIRWSPALLDRIRALHAEGAVELRWCTTWCADADRLEELWRLPRLARALDADPMPRGADCWPLKLAAARAVLAEGRRLIWTDDEALPPAGPARAELAAGGRALLIAPPARRGLRPADLAAIEAFAGPAHHPVPGQHRAPPGPPTA